MSSPLRSSSSARRRSSSAPEPEAKAGKGSEEVSAGHLAPVAADEATPLQLFDRLLATGDTARTELRRQLGTQGLTELGYEVLNTLKAQTSSAILPSEISNLTGILRGTLTDVLTRLELSGLITRRRSTEDRRQVFAELTPLGRRRCEAAALHRRSVILALMHKLTPVEWHSLDVLLGEISQGLAEAQQRALFPSHES